MDAMRIVHSLDELLILPRDSRVNGLRSRAEVRLEIPDIARPELVRAQDSLNELQERRGALAGAGVMLELLIAGVIEVMQRHASLLSWRAAAELFGVLALAFALGFIARLASCAYTRRQFGRRCLELHRALAGQLLEPALPWQLGRRSDYGG
jgi:hypothetical protein